MGDYSTLEMLDIAYGPEAASSWLVAAIANLNSFAGSKSMDDEQTVKLAVMLAQEYKTMKYSVMQLFFYKFKCGHFGKFYGKVDPMVITCALKDFSEECASKKQEYLREEYEVLHAAELQEREKLYRNWYNFKSDFLSQVEQVDGEIFSSLSIDILFIEDRYIQLSATREQYELLEGMCFPLFSEVFAKYFKGYALRYRLASLPVEIEPSDQKKKEAEETAKKEKQEKPSVRTAITLMVPDGSHICVKDMSKQPSKAQ